MRLRKVVHRACPMVCAPDSAVMSRADRPCLLNSEMSVPRLAVDCGRLLLARDALAVVESRRPSGTFQVGPPSYVRADNRKRRISVRRVVIFPLTATIHTG